MNNKVKELKEKAQFFQRLLEENSDRDIDAASLLIWLTPLFQEIQNDRIIPPQRYEFYLALGKDNDFYERHKDIQSAEAKFISALEDWDSQEWFQKLKE